MPSPKRPDPMSLLTGGDTPQRYPGGIALPGEGGKFTPDGCLQIWPGNTFIFHIPRGPAHELLMEIQERIMRSEFAPFLTFMPPPSFHMTIFNGVNPGASFAAGWDKPFDPNWSRDRMSAEMLERVRDLTLPRGFRVKMSDLYCLHSATMEGATPEEEDRLRQLRVDLAEATGMRQRNMQGGDSYVFHITLAYVLRYVTKTCAREMLEFGAALNAELVTQMPEIELDQVEFCNFDSMHHFEPLRRLG